MERLLDRGFKKESDENEIAFFGLGEFHSQESFFSSLKCAKRTAVGLCGGKKKHPTYEEVGDHVEVVLVEFDPKAKSFLQLLGMFWTRASSSENKVPRRHAMVIFCDNEEQAKLANTFLERVKGENLVRVEPMLHFWLASEEHQQFLKKKRTGGIR